MLHNLRQQGEHREGVPNRSLGDFVAPKETGLADHVGAFAVTAGLGSQEKIKEFKEALDDYSAILLESLADRLAEAFAERMHQRVRMELWGHDARRDPRQRGPDRREVHRHPPRARLPRLPRAHREGHPLGAARRAGDHRDRAHRVDGDVARRVGQRLVLLPPAVAVLRRRPARPRPGRVLRRAQGLDHRARPRSGSRPTSATTRRTECDDDRSPRPCSGTWTARSSTPSRTGSSGSTTSPRSTAAAGPTRTRWPSWAAT